MERVDICFHVFFSQTSNNSTLHGGSATYVGVCVCVCGTHVNERVFELLSVFTFVLVYAANPYIRHRHNRYLFPC